MHIAMNDVTITVTDSKLLWKKSSSFCAAASALTDADGSSNKRSGIWNSTSKKVGYTKHTVINYPSPILINNSRWCYTYVRHEMPKTSNWKKLDSENLENGATEIAAPNWNDPVSTRRAKKKIKIKRKIILLFQWFVIDLWLRFTFYFQDCLQLLLQFNWLYYEELFKPTPVHTLMFIENEITSNLSSFVAG